MSFRNRLSLLISILFSLILFLLPSAYAGSDKVGSETKPHGQVSDAPRRHTVRRTRKHSARRASTAPAAPRSAAARSNAVARRRVPSRRRRLRRSRQTWSASSYGDSAAGDSPEGEDRTVREAALAALDRLNGSVVVVDPHSGRILTMVNQKLALSGGEQPCSTIKLPVTLAALNEGLIDPETPVKLSRRWSLNLTEALAHSNNQFFEMLGARMGFEKLSYYAHQFGLGELAGYNIPGETLGTFPEEPARTGGVSKMSSFGEEILVTPLQLGALVSAIANGGTLYYLQYPRTPEELQNFHPMVKRQLTLGPLLPALRAGMMAAVEHGTGKRAALPFDTVLGKTGTCRHDGAHLGWFASYEGQPDPRLVVVVLLRGGRLSAGPVAAEVAGRVYRNLHERNYFASAALKSATDQGNSSSLVHSDAPQP